MLLELKDRIKFWRNADRIGPDIPTTYWKLFFKKEMKNLCKEKFQAFGDSSEVRPGAYIIGCSQISVGNRVIIRPGCIIHGESSTLDITIIIEDNVLLASGVHIIVENHRFENMDVPIIDQGYSDSRIVRLRNGCWLGANCIVLPGVEIGENSVIGAGSIVTKNIPAKVFAAGNPAKVIRALD